MIQRYTNPAWFAVSLKCCSLMMRATLELIQAMSLLDACLSPMLFVPRSSSGPMHLGLPATLVSVALLTSLNNISGRTLWTNILENLSMAALCVQVEKHHIFLRLVCFILYLFPAAPWSHIAFYSITGLLTSQGNNTILTIVDHFSKAVHFVALPKMPKARETADILVQHVFRLHGIPLDIVSDRGPQFTSPVWKAFCHALGATVRFIAWLSPSI